MITTPRYLYKPAPRVCRASCIRSYAFFLINVTNTVRTEGVEYDTRLTKKCSWQRRN